MESGNGKEFVTMVIALLPIGMFIIMLLMMLALVKNDKENDYIIKKRWQK